MGFFWSTGAILAACPYWSLQWLWFVLAIKVVRPLSQSISCCCYKTNTRHRASTSMYSLTFCVRFLLPERHQRKPAEPGRRSNVENAPHRRPITGKQATPTSHIRRTILRTPPVTRQSAHAARRPRPAGRLHYIVISRDGRKLVTRVRVMLS